MKTDNVRNSTKQKIKRQVKRSFKDFVQARLNLCESVYHARKAGYYWQEIGDMFGYTETGAKKLHDLHIAHEKGEYLS